jgi:hypothetical protein
MHILGAKVSAGRLIQTANCKNTNSETLLRRASPSSLLAPQSRARSVTHYKPRLFRNALQATAGRLRGIVAASWGAGSTYYFLWEQGERQEADPPGASDPPRLNLSSCPYKPEQKFQLLYVIIYIVHSERLLLHCRFVVPSGSRNCPARC